jgi:hypothetical protein
MSIYKCNQCNIEFKTNSGLWKHNKNKHINNILINIYKCKYCDKELSDRHSLWRHENKTCKKNPELNKTEILITNQFNISDNGVVNQINNKINNNVTINFNAIGKEDILALNEKQKEEVLNDGLNSIITLIKHLNFNKDIPENHTFCNTNLNNKYISALNTKTNEIEKHRKVDYFDRVLFYSIAHLKKLNETIEDYVKQDDFEKKIVEIEKYIYLNPEHKKIYGEQLNLLSYNKKNMIQNTWNMILFGNIIND